MVVVGGVVSHEAEEDGGFILVLGEGEGLQLAGRWGRGTSGGGTLPLRAEEVGEAVRWEEDGLSMLGRGMMLAGGLAGCIGKGVGQG